MRRKFRAIADNRHAAERAHTVCLLCVIQYALIFSVSNLILSALVTTLVFVRDVHLTSLLDKDIES